MRQYLERVFFFFFDWIVFLRLAAIFMPKMAIFSHFLNFEDIFLKNCLITFWFFFKYKCPMGTSIMCINLVALESLVCVWRPFLPFGPVSYSTRGALLLLFLWILCLELRINIASKILIIVIIIIIIMVIMMIILCHCHRHSISLTCSPPQKKKRKRGRRAKKRQK